MFIDDTMARILEIIKEHKAYPGKKRTGTFTTGIVSDIGKHKIFLFFAGSNHAGENAQEFLKKRSAELDRIQYMCDALPCNMPKNLAAIIINCLAHARRNFIDVEDHFPEQCAKVIASFAEIYKHDAEAKEQQMSDDERLAHHQKYSKPVMDELKTWCEQQIAEHLVEPNSGLGAAINYLLKHWDKLTQFLRVAGAALDNNIVEESLKIPIRLRKSAYFYATRYSAFIGSMLTSIILTAARAGANPVEYLTALQQYKTEVHKSPQDWMPWNYAEAILKLQPATVVAAAA